MRLLYAFAVLTVVGLVSGSERTARSEPMTVAVVDSSVFVFERIHSPQTKIK